jgi:thioredoxin reductase
MDRPHIEARAFEANEALAEGVKIRWLSSISDIGESALRVERMEMDADRHPQPTGQFETLSANSVILALGRKADNGFLRKLTGVGVAENGTVIVDAAMMTGHPGVLAGGDVAPGDEQTVTAAVDQSKKAARHISAWLQRPAAATGPEMHVIYAN